MADRMVAAGGPYPPQREYRADGGYDKQPLTEGAAPSPAEPYGQPLLLPQYRTEGVLRERLAELGHAPRFGHELTGFEQDSDGVIARLTRADGATITVRARYLVGADGAPLAHDARGDDVIVRAGDRAPDAPCRGAGGQPVDLFTLLSAGGWSLLRYEPAKDARIAPRKGVGIVDVGPNAGLRDDGGHLRAAYGFAPGDVALIRPDGDIGVLGSGGGNDALDDYLKQFA